MSQESLSKTSSSKAGWVLLGAAAVLAAGSIGYNIYDGRGDESAVQSAQSGQPTIEELRQAAESSSGETGPWIDLAVAHYDREEFAKSVEAYERAIEIDDSDASLWSALGEVRAYTTDQEEAAGDPMPQNALAAFQKAIELDPEDPRARYFLAVKKDLDGDFQGAIDDWLTLLADTPPGAPWEVSTIRTIRQVGAINEVEVEERLAAVNAERAPQVAIPGSGAVAGEGASAELRGPTQQQIADAAQLPPDQQRDMVLGMVDGLEEKLRNNPQDLNRWVMLMRSRMTLGEPAKASAALAAAIAANPQEEEELRRQAGVLGVP